MKIQNIVVLMLENRSFDHLLGAPSDDPTNQVERLKGDESNSDDPRVPGSPKTIVTPASKFLAPYGIPFDPLHEFLDVQTQLYGPQAGGSPSQTPAPNPPSDPTPMNGFMFSANTSVKLQGDDFAGDSQEVMEYYLPEQIPVITTLASSFAVFNWWFSSLPGPTWPNRYFIHAASSGGLCDSPTTMQEAEGAVGFGFSFQGGTIYDRLTAAGKQWRIYHDGLPQAASISSLWPEFINPFTVNFREMGNFQADVAAQTMPEYVFIEPNYDVSGNYLNGNSMHPLNDIRKGELLVKMVYETIRNSSYWDKTLLIVTFDEHGGFYDHVPPPAGVPTGDDRRYANSQHPFGFDRLGVRVPGILISAYSQPGTVIDNDAQGNRYIVDHTSVLATVEKLFGLQPLTQRDKVANTVDIALNCPAGNAEAPTSLPDPQAPALQQLYAAAEKVPPAAVPNAPISNNQRSFLALAHACNLHMTDPVEHPALQVRYKSIGRQKEAADYIREVEKKVKLRRRPSRYLAPHPERKSGHKYHYHPPRADHPLLRTAPKAPKRVTGLPSAVDLRNYCLAIRDQGQEGACSGFATAAFRESSHAVASGSILPDYLAPAYLYARTRMNEGTFPQDSGASLADEFDVLQNHGVCPEAFLPYTATPAEAPTPAADVAALPFRVAQPLQVDFKDPAAVKSVLAAKETIAMGFMVYESFESPSPQGVLSLPNTRTEKFLGGHAVLVCGYDDESRWWIVRNQWGTAWGVGGYCFMPYGYETLWTEAWTGVPQA